MLNTACKVPTATGATVLAPSLRNARFKPWTQMPRAMPA